LNLDRITAYLVYCLATLSSLSKLLIMKVTRISHYGVLSYVIIFVFWTLRLL